MNRKAIASAATVLILVAAPLVLFNNCGGGGLPSEVNSPSTNSTAPTNTETVPSGSLSALAAKAEPASIYTDQSSQVIVSGGKPPYTYAVVGGSANISATGAVTGSFSVGSIVIRVSDAAGQTVNLPLMTATRPTTPTTPSNPTYASCPLPWGGSIAHGASVTAFNASVISCPSPGACASETRTCNNGSLSGSYTAPSCSTRACVFKNTDVATDQSSGNQICQGSYSGGDNGGVNYNIPVVNYVAQIPASCSAAQYNSAKYCLYEAMGGGGDNGYTYRWSLYTCRGADEVIAPVYHSSSGSGGN